MDPKVAPSEESLQRYRDMDRAEVRICPICNTEVTNGTRTVRMDNAQDDEWVHYWHVEPEKT